MCGAKKKAQKAIAAVTQQANTAVADAQAETQSLREQMAAMTPAPAPAPAAPAAPQPAKPVMPEQVAWYDRPENYAQADIEARLRRRRAGAAANVLTSPTGIPATRTLGGVTA